MGPAHGQGLDLAIVDEIRIHNGSLWWEQRDEDSHDWEDFLPEYLVRRARQERDDDVADRMRRLASLSHLDSADYWLGRRALDPATRLLASPRG